MCWLIRRQSQSPLVLHWKHVSTSGHLCVCLHCGPCSPSVKNRIFCHLFDATGSLWACVGNWRWPTVLRCSDCSNLAFRLGRISKCTDTTSPNTYLRWKVLIIFCNYQVVYWQKCRYTDFANCKENCLTQNAFTEMKRCTFESVTLGVPNTAPALWIMPFVLAYMTCEDNIGVFMRDN